MRTDISIPAVVWTRDGRSLIHGEIVDGRPTLFRWSIAGGKAAPLASFNEELTGFALSRDETRLALAKGTGTSDVVLIRREK